MAIDWDHLTRPGYDRIVEALVDRLHPGEATAINGRGGDNGRDIVVRSGDHERVLQLKFFPEGFSTVHGKRRGQIKRSWDSVKASEPHEWILVVPCTLTDGERKFVTELVGDSTTRLQVWDRPFLDSHLAAHPDLAGHLARTDTVLGAAKILRQERSMLLGGLPDVADRTSALGELVNTLDPNWGLDIEYRRGLVTQTLFAKHPRAAVISPVTIVIEGEFGAEHGDLARTVGRMLDYGLSEEITLPREVVHRLTVDGPDWLKRTHSNPQVMWQPIGDGPAVGQVSPRSMRRWLPASRPHTHLRVAQEPQQRRSAWHRTVTCSCVRRPLAPTRRPSRRRGDRSALDNA